MTVFIGLIVQESYASEPYEVLMRVEDIIDVSNKYVTYRCGDEKTVDSLILGESLESVVKKLSAAGVTVCR